MKQRSCAAHGSPVEGYEPSNWPPRAILIRNLCFDSWGFNPSPPNAAPTTGRVERLSRSYWAGVVGRGEGLEPTLSDSCLSRLPETQKLCVGTFGDLSTRSDEGSPGFLQGAPFKLRKLSCSDRWWFTPWVNDFSSSQISFVVQSIMIYSC